MNQDEIKLEANSIWVGLPIAAKGSFLSQLSHNLTISVRSVYADHVNDHVDVDKTLKKMYCLNEMQHTISSTLMRLTGEAKLIEPDEHLVERLYGIAQEGSSTWELTAAFDFTLQGFR
jgi:hypothetical protein